MKIHNYGDLIILEYNNTELYQPNGERHLISSEYTQLENWLFSQLSRMPQYAVRDPENLRYRIVDKIVKKCYWKDLASAKRFVSMLLRNYVAQFKSLPDVEVKK